MRALHPVKDKLDVSWRYVAAVLCVDVLVLAFLLSDLLPERAWRELYDATWRLIDPRTARALAVLAITFAMLWIGRLRLAQLQAGWRQFPDGVVYAAVPWIVVQLGLAAWSEAAVVWPGLRELVFYTVAAFNEELLFRGLLLVWLVGRARKRGWREPTALIASVVLSSFVFALAHVPLHYATGAQASDMFAALGGHVELGVLFGALMLITRNVWATTFVHVIVNARPGSRGADAMTPWIDPYAIAAVLVAVLWLLLVRARTRR